MLNNKKERFKKFKSKRPDGWYRATTYIAMVASLVSIFSIIYTIKLGSKLNKLNYSPQLVVSKCQLTDFKKLGSTTFQYSVRAIVTLKNIGNNNAHLMMSVSICIPVGEDFLRKEKNKKDFAKNVRDAPREYYSDKQIYPTQEFIVSPLVEGLNSSDSIFTLHFWFVYKNDNGIIYDSYYWYSGKITENPEKPICFDSENNSFHIYSWWESWRIRHIYKINVSKRKGSGIP
jgi:hypothetical protein